MNKKITNLFSQITRPKEGKMNWDSKFGTAVKITVVVAFAGAILTSCVQKKDCDLLTDAKKKELREGTASNKTVKEFGHCDVTIPVDPNKCKPLEDELTKLETDSTYWHGQMVDLEEPALTQPLVITNSFSQYVKHVIENEGYAHDTDLDMAKVYKRAIELYLLDTPNSANKVNLQLWYDACDKFEKAAPKPAPQREAFNNCKNSGSTAMTSKEKIKQGSNIMAGSPFA